jgi:hypothetical protein
MKSDNAVHLLEGNDNSSFDRNGFASRLVPAPQESREYAARSPVEGSY